jgi:nicotinate-nucleotide adenylyltransferase
MIRTGIYGGTFDPIHNGHIALAHAFLESGELDELWFIVSPQNPFKQNKDLLPDDARLEMVKAALRGEEKIVASDYEFHLPKPSYMWNTLCHLREDYPDREFTLLIGGDNWQSFSRWYHYEDILATHRIMIYPREGSEVDAARLPANVSLCDTPLINISSTDIRQRVQRGEDISSLVPQSVATLIIRNGYYK